MKHKRIYIIISASLLVVILMLTILANFIVVNSTKKFVTGDLTKLANHKVGLLLGTSKNLSNGEHNQYFFNRIDATVELFNAGKIKYVIISGDNSKKDYNEPLDMKIELLNRGIPEHKIYLDYAGFRTFDSVIRARDVFGQKSLIIISQKFHNERAVYIAQKNGINAFGYNAKDVHVFYGIKTQIREFLARDKMFLDMFFKTEPKYLGSKIIIE